MTMGFPGCFRFSNYPPGFRRLICVGLFEGLGLGLVGALEQLVAGDDLL